MGQCRCGFDSNSGAPGSILLARYGPTLFVDIGFDPGYDPKTPAKLPTPAITKVEALVDTGAGESCIDSLLASQLNLPIIDKKHISGIGGQQEANIYMAQIHVPALGFTVYGSFCGVHLQAGGQWHKALMGRAFLQAFTMVYEGKTGTVTLSS